MKRIYTNLVFCLLINIVFAQNERYDFTLSNEAYVPLTNAEALDFLPDDDWVDLDESLELEIELGFSVPILGLPGMELFNFISPALLVSNFDDEEDDPVLPFIIPTTLQLQNRGSIPGNSPSEILFQTSGNDGNQIFKLEYRDVGFANESLQEVPTQDMFTNIQLWIYEGSGCIEFRYGETSITDPELIYDEDPGSAAGLFRALGSQLDTDTVLYAIFTTGDSQDPAIFEGEITDVEPAALSQGYPASGVVYTFCPEVETSTTDLNRLFDWEVFPNPTLDFLTVKLNDFASADYSLIAMNGQVVTTGIVDADNKKVDVRDLSKGIYMLTIQTENGIATKRFWKK